jgi:hypothetical protein
MAASNRILPLGFGAVIGGESQGRLVGISENLLFYSSRNELVLFERRGAEWGPNFEEQFRTDLPKVTALALDERGMLISGDRASLLGQSDVRAGEVYWLSLEDDD